MHCALYCIAAAYVTGLSNKTPISLLTTINNLYFFAMVIRSCTMTELSSDVYNSLLRVVSKAQPSCKEALEAYRVVRRRGSHFF
jgi:hypothetical protein